MGLGDGPTRRELVIVTVLLTSLLVLSQTNYNFKLKRAPLPFEATNHSTPSVVPQQITNNLFWGSSHVAETKVVAHVPGWTIFDKLYLLNGTLFVVTDDPSNVPDLMKMISKGINIDNADVHEPARLPTPRQMQIVSTKAAKKAFGTSANVIDGVSFLVNDPAQYITHYYHWCAELWFGFWRTYSSLDPKITSHGNTTLTPPRRMMFIHLDADHWRDYASMNQWVVRSSFPGLTEEFVDDWRDRAEMGKLFVFERVVLADRSAAMMGYNYLRTQRTAAEPFALPGSVNWWMTIRNNVVEATGLTRHTGRGTTVTPVITYISRQGWGRRMLIPADHEKLVSELYKLRDNYGYEVNIVRPEKMTRIEQLQLAARTTIMMGVHGNGLTSLIWMKPSPRSTVMEFFYPDGFAHDYEYTTRALGMIHYGWWGSRSFTSPGVPEPRYPEGFQGNEIPIDGEAVARLCVERLSLAVEADD